MPSWIREALAQCLGLDIFLSYNQRIIMYFHSPHRLVRGLETLDCLWKKCLLSTSFTQQTFLAFSIVLRRCWRKLLLGNLSMCCKVRIAVLYLTVGYSILDSGALSLKLWALTRLGSMPVFCRLFLCTFVCMRLKGRS